MSEGTQYISWATKFDIYKGALNWQDLSRSERMSIVRYELEGMPEDLDIYEFVMSTNLRRIQFDGLRTVITDTALALEEELGVRFEIESGARYSLILPYLEGTALGQELISLINGKASTFTNYRMGELEFLAQSGSRSSPLDKLLDLPRDIRLQAILRLLKPKGAFDPPQNHADDLAPEVTSSDLNSLSFSKVIQLIEAGQLDMRASYAGSLQAVSQGLLRVGTTGTLASIGFYIAPIGGFIAGLLFAWWWLPLGLIVGILAFRYSRKAALHALLRRACTDELFFESMRKHRIIWLERLR